MPSYAEIRKQELEHIERELKNDRKMKATLKRVYDGGRKDIQDRIDAELMRVAMNDQVSMAEAKRLISKTDVEGFQATAKRMVRDKDFSKRANRELRKYNVTMRTNRLEYLQALINMETVRMATAEEDVTLSYITEAHMTEYKRQSGILGMTLPSEEKLHTMARSAALADVSGVTFSDRIWADQAELRESINRTIERTLIRGEHPRKAATEIAKSLRDDVGNARYKAERIAITETARAQTIAQRESFREADIEQYMFIAESDACPVCKALDGKTFKVADMMPGKNAPFMHPFCRCSTGAYV